MISLVKRLVSQNKRRYQECGFDLDLSYITPCIIAMGYPSEGIEAMYRNDMGQVINFLTKFHNERFKIFNLCTPSEGEYDPAKLGGNVMKIPFENHNPAPLASMLLFCQSATAWLSENPDNVITVHCKAGKGRTGLMICALLLYMKRCADTEAALTFYGVQRTKNGKGVTIPSQIRYVRYFEDVLANGFRPEQELLLSKIIVTAATPMDFHFKIFSSTGYLSSQVNANGMCEQGCLTYDFKLASLSGDIKVDVFSYGRFKEVLQFYFRFNTSYVDSTLRLRKNDLDKPLKSTCPQIEILLLFSPKE